MKKALALAVVLVLCAAVGLAHGGKSTEATITKVDMAGKSMVVKTADGKEATIYWNDATKVQGTLKEGETNNEYIAWCEKTAAPYNPSALSYDERFYVLWDFGFLNCRSAKTGREIYEKQRLKTDGTAGFTGSPWAYRGRVFCLSEDGDTYVIRAGDKFQVERVNALDEMCMATPACSGDRLFIRTMSRLYCIRQSP